MFCQTKARLPDELIDFQKRLDLCAINANNSQYSEHFKIPTSKCVVVKATHGGYCKLENFDLLLLRGVC